MTQTSGFDTEVDDNHSTKRRADRPIVVQFQGTPPTSTPPTGPRASRPDKWVSLAEDGEYAEHQIRIRLRFSDAVSVATQSGDTRAFQDGLRAIVLEHNSWLNPEVDEPTVLPPTDQPCAVDAELDAALADEDVKHAEALRVANLLKDKTERKAAVVAAESAHTQRTAQLRLDATSHKAEQKGTPCCFWDSLSQEEILLILAAIRRNKRERVSFLLGTKTD